MTICRGANRPAKGEGRGADSTWNMKIYQARRTVILVRVAPGLRCAEQKGRSGLKRQNIHHCHSREKWRNMRNQDPEMKLQSSKHRGDNRVIINDQML